MQNGTLSILLTIVDRGKGDRVAQLLQAEQVLTHFIALGSGTAHQDLLSLLGLRDTAKDVVISFLPTGHARQAMHRLAHALEIDLPGKGISFTVPLSSVGGPKALHYLMGQAQTPAEEERNVMQEEIRHDLVVAIVNRGFTDLVMDAARPAGARGGTVIHARGAGAQEASRFLNITIQPEKEMVLILVERDQKIPVMQAITKGAGLNTEGRGIVFSLPVTDVMGVHRANEGKEGAEQ